MSHTFILPPTWLSVLTPRTYSVVVHFYFAKDMVEIVGRLPKSLTGCESHPDWCPNLTANPPVRVQIDAGTASATDAEMVFG